MSTHLRVDRRGLGFGAAVALAYVVLGSPLPLALGAFVLIYALNAAFTRPSAFDRRPAVPAIEPGTPEAAWVDRARRAALSIDRLRRYARSPAIADRCGAIATQARISVSSLQRLAYQVDVVRSVSPDTDVTEIRTKEERVRMQLGATTGATRLELDRTIATLVARRESAERLLATRQELDARIEAGALGLEGVVARVAEIVAMTDDTSRSTGIDHLASELDSLREALIATQDIGGDLP